MSTRTVNPNSHTDNADHGLTAPEWLEAMESINNPLAITSYRNLQDNYRVYTYATKNGKSICLGMEVKRKGNSVEISNVEEFTDIRTAFGRDIESALNNERILYPEGLNAAETIRRNFAQSSEGYNSLLYEQNSVSAANVEEEFGTSKLFDRGNVSEMRNSAPPARSVAQDIYNNEVEDTWIYFFRFGHFICCAEIFSTFEADFAEALSAYFWEKKKHSLLFAFSQERRKLIWNNKHGNNK